MGLQARRSASWSPGAEGPRRGVLRLLPRLLPLQLLLLLLLLRPRSCGAAAPGEAEAPILYLWKTGKWDGVPPFFLLHIWVPVMKLLGFRGTPLCFSMPLGVPGS